MASYRIVCTEQEPVTQPTTHAHIVAVGTGNDPDTANRRWTLKEVLAAMGLGDTFYTQGKTSGKIARVVKYTCGLCGRTHIRSSPDAVQDNNLDSLRRCSWKS
jgi:hypothetical protein